MNQKQLAKLLFLIILGITGYKKKLEKITTIELQVNELKLCDEEMIEHMLCECGMT